MSSDNLFFSYDALLNLRIATQNAMAAQVQTQNEYTKAKNELEKWKKRFDLALNSDRNDLLEATKFQIERYKMIVSKLEPLLVDQETQLVKIKKQGKYWEDKLKHKNNNDVDTDVNTTSSYDKLSLRQNPIFSDKEFDIFFDEIDLIVDIISQKLSNKVEDFIDCEEIRQFLRRLEQEVLVKMKMLAEFEFKLVSHQIEYYQVLKEAKIWKARAREVDKWGVDEISQLANAQFQSFRAKAIELNKPIKNTEENIGKAKNLIDQYRQKLDALNEKYSKLFQVSSPIEEPQEYEDSIDAELESLKTKLDSL